MRGRVLCLRPEVGLTRFDASWRSEVVCYLSNIAKDTPELESVRPNPDNNMARILSISYNESLLKTRELMLRSHHHEVASALGFVKALELCGKQKFDLVIMEHTIPAKDKQQILVQLRAVCTTPILALLRADESPLQSAEFNLDSSQPGDFVDLVDKIVSKK